MKLLLLILMLITSTTRAVTNERCLRLGQKNIVLTCPPCSELEQNVSAVEWCIQGAEIPTKCSRDTFRSEFDLDVINGDLLLPRVLNLFDQAIFNCTRSCSGSEDIVEQTEVSVSSVLKKVIFKDRHKDEVTWHNTETGRFLCFGNLGSGNTTFSWVYDGQELRNVEDISDRFTNCNADFQCSTQECLLPVIKLLTTNETLPHPYVLKRSACKPSNNSVTDGDFFQYILLLVFGVVSLEYEGRHQFIVSEHIAGKTTDVSDVSTNVIVSQADVKPLIALQNLVDSKLTLKKQSNFDVVCEVAGRSDVPTNVSWTRSNGMVPRFNDSSTCRRANSSVFYTVISNTIRTRDYPNNTINNNSVIASTYIVTLHLCNATTAVEDEYYCEAYNISKPLQVSVVEVKDQEKSTEETKLEVALIIGFIVLNSVLLAAIAMTTLVLCWIKRSNKKQSCHQLMSHSAGLPVYLHSARQLDTSSLQDSDLKSDPLEFPYDQLEMLHPLGEGNFGRVYKARANDIIPGDNVRNVVAVKTLKDNARPSDIDDLEQELHILKMIQPHCNILNLLGYCNKPGIPLCLIIEFAFHGSLKEFLKLCREHLDKQPANGHHTPVHSGYLNDTSYYNESSPATPAVAQQAIQHVTQYVNNDNDWYMYQEQVASTSDYYNTSTSQLQKDYHTKLNRLSVIDIYFFMLQIAKGMEHIGRMKLVHRDLAARNVLIAEGFVLKIGDFGLSRNLTDKDYYRKTGRGMIPARWMALESLDGGVHTYQSDVWSYGVVIWEILTYADIPYGMEHFTKSIKGIIEYLKSGNRLSSPPIFGSTFYPTMSRCWEIDPNKRPSFSELVMLCETEIAKLKSS